MNDVVQQRLVDGPLSFAPDPDEMNGCLRVPSNDRLSQLNETSPDPFANQWFPEAPTTSA